MATILLAWELGGGLGHLINLFPLAQGLSQRGHRVVAAVQDIGRAERSWRGLDIAYLQAPAKTYTSPGAIEPQRSFAHILHNHGFGDLNELRALAGAWRSLFEMVKPDLIVMDHCPTGLLAVRGLPARKAIIGTGFFCPLDEYPMADLRPWLPAATERLRQDEDHVLANANATLASWGQPPLERLSRLFNDVDETFLATLPELDHYPGRCTTVTTGSSLAGRRDIKYWGVWPHVGGKRPCWPEAEGERVFAYVRPFPALPRLLQQLAELRQPTIVYSDGIDAEICRRFTTETMRFENRPLDLAAVGASCDLAILNGTNGTSTSMLLAGRPTLQVPIALEHALFSRAVTRLGAGILAAPNKPEEVIAGLMQMLGSDDYAVAARRFAAKYAVYNSQQHAAAVIERAEELLLGHQPVP